MTEIEKTERYVTTVKAIDEAWPFIMGVLDNMKCEAPQIIIKPFWFSDIMEALSGVEPQHGVEFEVTVEGVVDHD